MSFFLVTNGHVHPHNFDYLVDESGGHRERLEKTLPHGNPYKIKKIEFPKGAKHFVIEKMSRAKIQVEENETLEKALELLAKNKIHHLPVLKNKKIIGMLSDRDLIKLKGDTLFKLISVKDIMASIVLCCDEETEVIDVAKVFVKEMISAVAVITKTGELRGIITKTDILSSIITHEFFD